MKKEKPIKAKRAGGLKRQMPKAALHPRPQSILALDPLSFYPFPVG